MPKPNTAQKLREDADVKRDLNVVVRVSAEEREAWRAAADADQRKLSDWIRIAVNAHLESSPKPKKGGKS
jgi:hypothetical protein